MLMRISTLIIVGLTVLAIASLVKLGFWQLDRAAEKQQLFDDFEHAMHSADNADLLTLPTDTANLTRFQPVRLTGSFHPTYLLLDNQIYQGRVGYQVIGLLESAARNTLQPVNLGWVAADYDRNQVPQVQLPQGNIEITGWWYPPNQEGIQLAQQLVEPFDQAFRIQKAEFEILSTEFEQPIAPAMILLAESADFGWPRHWQPAVMPPEKHQAYALQWFSLALAAVIVVFFVRRSQIKTKKKECA